MHTHKNYLIVIFLGICIQFSFSSVINIMPVQLWISGLVSGLNWPCYLFIVALCNRETIYIFMLWFVLLYSFFSSPNLSSRRLDVYHTSAHGVVLV